MRKIIECFVLVAMLWVSKDVWLPRLTMLAGERVDDAPTIVEMKKRFIELGVSHGVPYEKLNKVNEVAIYLSPLVSYQDSVGICFYWPDRKVVVFQDDYWYSASIMEKELIFFHEMGHCVFSMIHDDGPYLSIMNSYLMDKEDYLEYYWRLIEDFYDVKNHNTIGVLP